MEKSKKSIVIGLVVVLLITITLLGATYAYYRTRVIGNTSEQPSISVQSKKLEVTYVDGSASIDIGSTVEFNESYTKSWTVENTGGSSAVYSVVLDNINNTFERNQDWEYVLTKDGVEASRGHIAAGTHQVILPKVEMTPEETETAYVLTLTYVNSTEDQSEDMGSTLSLRVNITDEVNTWENASEGTLLYALKSNQPSGTEETIPGVEASTANEARILTTEDDYGTSYVYRGNVVNNYVTYSNMCWRVLRVQGDGTIKLVLADGLHKCGTANGYSLDNTTSAFITDSKDDKVLRNLTYKSDLSNDASHFVLSTSNVPNYLSTWASDYNLDTTKLVTADWCNDVSLLRKVSISSNNQKLYNSSIRINPNMAEFIGPSLKCNFKGINDTKAIRYNNIIGIISADEVAFAGSREYASPTLMYLTTNAKGTYLTPTAMTGGDAYAVVYNIYSSGEIDSSEFLNDDIFSIRPSIVLRSDVVLDTTVAGQNGGIDTPYVIG